GPNHKNQEGQSFHLPELYAQPHSWYLSVPAVTLTRNLEAYRKQKQVEKETQEHAERKWKEASVQSPVRATVRDLDLFRFEITFHFIVITQGKLGGTKSQPFLVLRECVHLFPLCLVPDRP